jgi:hypothetical protein
MGLAVAKTPNYLTAFANLEEKLYQRFKCGGGNLADGTRKSIAQPSRWPA